MIYKLLLILALTLVGTAADADLIAGNGLDSVRISDTQCTNTKVLARVKPEIRNRFFSASATVSGKAYSACWTLQKSVIYLIYEDGDKGVIPMDAFRKELST